ncbi:hypothetical protein [Myxococcus xanthus]|uniref:hypothetical protein n=1 Tax=Myxococcus xanthus TaxID=34 RepID=UPI001129D725|nr:hypothetical protein [Myxococcus xanthus]
MAKLISATKSGREEFIHRYLFEFWDESWGDATERISLAEKYYHGKCDNAQTPFAQRLLPRLVSSEAVVDIIALGGPHNRTLFPIEIKLGYLDDRGHGQILRYYQHARSICDRFNRDCDIRHVSPVLILSSATLSQWDAVPQYFKEIIHILFYRTTPAGHITLLDGKKVLNSQARDRLFNH